MVDAGHRAPGLVYSLQIVLVHRIQDVRIIEVGEVDKLIAIISAHTVRGTEPDKPISILDDIVHRIARQAILSRESLPV